MTLHGHSSKQLIHAHGVESLNVMTNSKVSDQGRKKVDNRVLCMLYFEALLTEGLDFKKSREKF